VRNNLLEQGGQGGGVDRFTLTDSHRAGGFVAVPSGDNAFGIGNHRAVVEKDVDVILGRQQGADIAFKYEVRTVGALDGFGHIWVGGVDQLAHLAADGLLPIGQAIDISVNTWVGSIGHYTSSLFNQLYRMDQPLDQQTTQAGVLAQRLEVRAGPVR